MSSIDTDKTAFPWDAAMAFGLGQLRLAPRDFWSMTPRELAAAMSAFAPSALPPDRADLGRMMERFPDQPTGSKNNG